MLCACLILPSLPLDVFARARPPDAEARPFAVATGGHYPRIVAADAAACAAGVRAGQLVSAALALAPGLVLRDRDPVAEAAALAAVAGWATQFTPAVSLAPPDAVLAEIGASLRLFGGLPKLVARLTQGAADLGYAARLALAPTPLAALLFARADRAVTVTDAPGLARALAPLPLALLDADPALVATLAAAGVTTFGQACALPRDGLARRAGAGFVALLDRARGLVPDPRPPFVPPPRYVGTLALPAPVANVEALAFAVNRLVHELAGWLLGRGLGVIELSLSLAHERYVGVKTGVAATGVRFALASPAREPAHLSAVLRERLARVALPAAVESIALASEATAPLAGRNLGLLPEDGEDATVPLLDRLRARLGEDAVTRVAPHAEHRPERAWREHAELSPAAARESRVRLDFPAPAPSGGAKRGKVESDPTFSPRPLWLLAEPEPLGHHLERAPWVLQDGPERIESGWWDGRDVRRDYFVAVTPRGETVWIYRDGRCGFGEGDGEWFLHGVFA
ncbi:MAG: DNA polymerase Y family protein [Betaproteobacteria bacterium]